MAAALITSLINPLSLSLGYQFFAARNFKSCCKLRVDRVCGQC